VYCVCVCVCVCVYVCVFGYVHRPKSFQRKALFLKIKASIDNIGL
jgi:hypothetical protein